VDPIAHTLTGAALAATGLRRSTPLATAALVIGANAPDIDVLASFAGSYAALALRRGWTHGVLAIVVLPFVVTGLLLVWDRTRPGRANRAAARAGPLLALAALAVLTHPSLDWLNNYGMRWLMPFDGRWSYGDALFIVDPWVWLALGGVLFLGGSRSPWAFALWVVFWLLGTWLLFSVPLVPAASRTLWAVTVAALFAVRLFRAETLRPPAPDKLARIALGCVIAYMATAVVASAVARREVRATLADLGIGPVTDVMVGPAAANPFAGTVVAATPEWYHHGEWRWFAKPRLRLNPQPIERRANDPIAAAASRTPAARDYLTWSRYPYFEVEPAADGEDGYVVRLRDARYRGLGLEGPDVRLDRNLKPLEPR
jgi:inner membrane protein